jgi:rare lipoprotein A
MRSSRMPIRHRLALLGALAWFVHQPVLAKAPGTRPAPRGAVHNGQLHLGHHHGHSHAHHHAERTAGQVVRASWYGNYHRMHHTANGEVFNRNAFTAAHKTLPFGTLLKVTNMRNGRSTVVRVNDRGPYVAGRSIDVTYAAARRLGMLGSGVARLRLEPVRPEEIQIAAQDTFWQDDAAHP